MLPNLHYQRYQEFKQALEQLQTAASRVYGLESRHFLETQQFFQQQIMSLDGDLESADESRIRSYQTEMSKQLRLLGMDMTFLQAARQPETAQARQMQLHQRIQTLISYCDALLQLN